MTISCRKILVVSCLGPRKDDSMVFISVHWSMTCWFTVERWQTTLELADDGCCLVSDRTLISILSMSVEPLEMLCSEAVVALAPRAGDLKAENLLSLLRVMCVFKKLNLS